MIKKFLKKDIHVFFKKHKFQKHEAQNAEILRNIEETLPG